MWQTEIFGLILPEESFLYDHPGEGPTPPSEAPSDVLLSGWAVRLTGEEQSGWVPVQSFYGYPGWLPSRDLCLTTLGEIQARQSAERFRQVVPPFLDLHAEPSVRGALLTALPRGAVAEALSVPESSGWQRIRTAAGVEGWVPSQSLRSRSVGDGYLLTESEDPAWFLSAAKARIADVGEDALRAGIAASALSWRGVSYRWGGKSHRGIDCSGLAFMSCMENGVLIYRDADLRDAFPVRAIPRDALAQGDLIFFPGHVAVYLGDGRYVHATAYAQTPWVTVNSLRPSDPLYRQDLAESITAVGSLFDL